MRLLTLSMVKRAIVVLAVLLLSACESTPKACDCEAIRVWINPVYASDQSSGGEFRLVAKNKAVQHSSGSTSSSSGPASAKN